MTVEELIRLLATFPGDLRVVVNGYEEGYDDLSPERINRTAIGLNTGIHRWEGRHGHPDDGGEVVEALLLSRAFN